MIQILKDLINIQSITKNEKAVCNHIENLLKSSGGNLIRENNSLVWESNSWKADRKTIALVGHIDTVPFNTDDWQIGKPTEAREIDGKIYGRGACDMKGGVSIILDLILNEDLGESYNVMAIIYEGEEFGMPNGITTLIEKKLLPEIDFAIVLEPTDRKIVSGVFTGADIEVTAKGKAGHSSSPIDADNAIYHLIDYIEATRQIPLETIQGTHEALSTTLIQGGNAANITPDKAVATINMRANPELSQEQLLARFPKSEHIKLEIVSWPAGHIIKPDHPILHRLVQQTNAQCEIGAYWTDVGQLGKNSIPAVNFGPGRLEECHIADEFVEISELQWIRDHLQLFLNT